MDHNDKAAIDGLFDRLRQAEAGSPPRDTAAEAHIRDTLSRQPAAPYYMAQAMLVQDHALQSLSARVEELERELANRPAAGGGGFLSSLFGGPRPQAPANGHGYGAQGYGAQRPGMGAMAHGMQPFQQAPRGSFMAGAMQTAVGVAGGLILGNMLADMISGGNDAQAAEQPAPEPAPEEESFADMGGGDEEFF